MQQFNTFISGRQLRPTLKTSGNNTVSYSECWKIFKQKKNKFMEHHSFHAEKRMAHSHPLNKHIQLNALTNI